MDRTMIDDVDINQEIEDYDSEHGKTGPEADKGILKDNDDDNQVDVLPGPNSVEGQMTVPPVTEDQLSNDDGEDDDKGTKSPETEKETKPARVFQTPEELEEYNELQRLRVEKELSQQGVDKDKPEQVQKFFEDIVDPTTGQKIPWKPKDWNDVWAAGLQNPKILEAITKAVVPEVQETVAKTQDQQQKEEEKISEQYDKDYDKLATSKGLPALSTEEGKAISGQIFSIGGKYLLPTEDKKKARTLTIDEMFDIWANTPASKQGGLEYVSKKNKSVQRKKDSGYLTPSRKAQPSAPTKKKPQYDHTHETDMDSLIEEGLEEYGN